MIEENSSDRPTFKPCLTTPAAQSPICHAEPVEACTHESTRSLQGKADPAQGRRAASLIHQEQRPIVIRNILIFLLCTLLVGACSSERTARSDTPVENGGSTISSPICFNHTLLILDSSTYHAAVHSEFIKKFAYSQERQLKGYKGFYLFGKTNYIELFHPKSFDGHEEAAGGMWINLAPLKANYVRSLNWEGRADITYGSDDHYHDLSLILKDSTNPISTWEMTKEHYESWTHKKYNDSVDFLPIDYYSQQDSDSSSNYSMNDVIGIALTANHADNLAMTNYLKTVGFQLVSENGGVTTLSNNDQFIKLHGSEDQRSPAIYKFVIRLNEPVQPMEEIIGNSRIRCDGEIATWYFLEHP